MFISPDEHILIMEDDFAKFYDDRDLEKLKEAGIRTIYVPRAVEYKNGILDVAQFYARTRKYEDFKILLPFYYGSVDKPVKEIYDEVRALCDYNAQLVYAVPEGGEFLWDTLIVKDFPKFDDQIIDEIITAQKLLVKQYGEVWLHLHNYLGDIRNWNNTHLEVVYKAVRNEFPNIPFYSVQFAHFAVANNPTGEDVQLKIKYYYEKYGIKSFVGSEYCEGLISNFDKAVEQKAYGFITSPIHSLQKIKHSSIEPWMVDTILSTNRKLNEIWL